MISFIFINVSVGESDIAINFFFHKDSAYLSCHLLPDNNLFYKFVKLVPFWKPQFPLLENENVNISLMFQLWQSMNFTYMHRGLWDKYIYTYDWLMLLYSKKQYKFVKQLSSN